jgi:hypothetical protein
MPISQAVGCTSSGLALPPSRPSRSWGTIGHGPHRAPKRRSDVHVHPLERQATDAPLDLTRRTRGRAVVPAPSAVEGLGKDWREVGADVLCFRERFTDSLGGGWRVEQLPTLGGELKLISLAWWRMTGRPRGAVWAHRRPIDDESGSIRIATRVRAGTRSTELTRTSGTARARGVRPHARSRTLCTHRTATSDRSG